MSDIDIYFSIAVIIIVLGVFIAIPSILAAFMHSSQISKEEEDHSSND